MLKIMMGGGGGGESVITVILHNGKKSRGRKRVAEVTACREQTRTPTQPGTKDATDEWKMLMRDKKDERVLHERGNL